MPVNIRSFPMLRGRDAERFIERQRENRKKLEIAVRKRLEELANRNYEVKKKR